MIGMVPGSFTPQTAPYFPPGAEVTTQIANPQGVQPGDLIVAMVCGGFCAEGEASTVDPGVPPGWTNIGEAAWQAETGTTSLGALFPIYAGVAVYWKVATSPAESGALVAYPTPQREWSAATFLVRSSTPGYVVLPTAGQADTTGAAVSPQITAPPGGAPLVALAMIFTDSSTASFSGYAEGATYEMAGAAPGGGGFIMGFTATSWLIPEEVLELNSGNLPQEPWTVVQVPGATSGEDVGAPVNSCNSGVTMTLAEQPAVPAQPPKVVVGAAADGDTGAPYATIDAIVRENALPVDDAGWAAWGSAWSDGFATNCTTGTTTPAFGNPPGLWGTYSTTDELLTMTATADGDMALIRAAVQPVAAGDTYTFAGQVQIQVEGDAVEARADMLFLTAVFDYSCALNSTDVVTAGTTPTGVTSGMGVLGEGIPAGTTVTGVAGDNITLSHSATLTTTTTLTFYTPSGSWVEGPAISAQGWATARVSATAPTGAMAALLRLFLIGATAAQEYGWTTLGFYPATAGLPLLLANAADAFPYAWWPLTDEPPSCATAVTEVENLGQNSGTWVAGSPGQNAVIGLPAFGQPLDAFGPTTTGLLPPTVPLGIVPSTPGQACMEGTASGGAVATSMAAPEGATITVMAAFQVPTPAPGAAPNDLVIFYQSSVFWMAVTESVVVEVNGGDTQWVSTNRYDDGNPHWIEASVGAGGLEVWIDGAAAAGTLTGTDTSLNGPAYVTVTDVVLTEDSTTITCAGGFPPGLLGSLATDGGGSVLPPGGLLVVSVSGTTAELNGVPTGTTTETVNFYITARLGGTLGDTADPTAAELPTQMTVGALGHVAVYPAQLTTGRTARYSTFATESGIVAHTPGGNEYGPRHDAARGYPMGVETQVLIGQTWTPTRFGVVPGTSWWLFSDVPTGANDGIYIDLTDYEVVPLTPTYYRVRAEGQDANTGDGAIGPWSTYQFTADATCGTKWFLLDPWVPGSAVGVDMSADPSRQTHEVATMFYPLGRSTAIKSTDGTKGTWDGTWTAHPETREARAALQALFASTDVLLIQSPYGEQGYVYHDPGTDPSEKLNLATAAGPVPWFDQSFSTLTAPRP